MDVGLLVVGFGFGEGSSADVYIKLVSWLVCAVYAL